MIPVYHHENLGHHSQNLLDLLKLGEVKKHIPSGNQTISAISQPFDDFLNQSSTFRQVLELVHVKQTGPFLRS